MKFKDLNTKGQLKAMLEYVKGWEETHLEEEEQNSLIEVLEILKLDEETEYNNLGEVQE